MLRVCLPRWRIASASLSSLSSECLSSSSSFLPSMRLSNLASMSSRGVVAGGRPSFQLATAAASARSFSTSDSSAPSGSVVTKEGDTRPLNDFAISEATQKMLRSRGIEQLFAIQVATFNPVSQGKDIVGRARTGTGKTLAFALPIVERVLKMPPSTSPRAMVLAPTRELARQITQEFRNISRLRTSCLYGGAGYTGQQMELQRGCDIVVGTPGRVSDMIHRGYLKLNEIRTVVLDEADHMLDIGFAEKMEEILAQVKNQSSHDLQTLLFSATIPDRIKSVVRNFLKPDGLYIDQISTQDTQASKTVTHYAVPFLWEDAAALTATSIHQFSGPKGRAIVFTNRKVEADDLAHSMKRIGINSQALHGDVSQRVRDTVIDRFRSGGIQCIVATDVAARGIDVPNVDIVIQVNPPDNIESYIHRSGRTGRAGKTGTAVILYAPDEHDGDLREIEDRAAIQIKRIRLVPENTKFNVRPVSMITGKADMVVIHVKNGVTSRSDAMAFVEQYAENNQQSIDSLRMVADGGFVFDLPEPQVQRLLDLAAQQQLPVEEVTELPELVSFRPNSSARIGAPRNPHARHPGPHHGGGYRGQGQHAGPRRDFNNQGGFRPRENSYANRNQQHYGGSPSGGNFRPRNNGARNSNGGSNSSFSQDDDM